MTIKSKAFVLVVFLFVVCFWPALCWFLDGMFCVFSCSDTLCWENFRVDLGTDSCKRCVELADAPSAGCRGASAVVVCPCSEAVGDPLTVFSDSLSVDFCYYLCFRHERCLELETIFWPFGYFSYLVGGMPDNLDFFMEYSSFDLCVHYMSDLFRYSVH